MTSQTSSSPALAAAEEQFVAARVPAVVAAGKSAGVVAVEEMILVEKAVFLAEGKLVAWRLFVVPPHKAVEPAVEPAVDVSVVGVAHNLDIVALAVGCLAEDPAFELPAFEVLAYVAVDRVDAVAYWDHCEDCR